MKNPSEEESAQIIEKADPIIEKAADEIKECKKFEERKLRAFDKAKSGFVNNIFYKKFVKADKFYAKDNCIGCGKCEELCMLNNIKLVDNNPVWGSDCIRQSKEWICKQYILKKIRKGR